MCIYLRLMLHGNKRWKYGFMTLIFGGYIGVAGFCVKVECRAIFWHGTQSMDVYLPPPPSQSSR